MHTFNILTKILDIWQQNDLYERKDINEEI